MRKKAAYLGVFTALACILGYIESLIPFFFGIPGMKIGLANLVVISLLYLFGAKEAALVSLVRILILAALFGNLFSMLYSLAGAAFSLLVMLLIKRTERFHIVTVSIAGACAHNIAQLIVAALVVETYQVGYYLPFLLVGGIAAGIVIGILGAVITKRLKGVIRI